MRRILVTGALGQIGSELVVALRQRYGTEAVIASDIRLPPLETLRPGERFEFLDSTNARQIQDIVRNGEVGTVYHLAALLSATSEEKPHVAWELNMGGLYKVLEVARQHDCKVFFPSSIGAFGPGTPKDGGTIYLGTADASGMMVSLIQSNYTGFGSGVVVPGTGIALQNRGTGFVTTKGHPNEVGPNKRPFHTIIPAFITKDGKPVATFGLMGGAMQPQGHMQVFSRIVDYGQNPQAAIDAPRWRVHETDGTVWTEEHMPQGTLEGLESRGHRLTRTKMPSFDFGSSQIIWRFPDGGPYLGASESRRDGAAVGF